MKVITLAIILLITIFLIGCAEVIEEVETPEEPSEENISEDDTIPIPEFPEDKDVPEEEDLDCLKEGEVHDVPQIPSYGQLLSPRTYSLLKHVTCCAGLEPFPNHHKIDENKCSNSYKNIICIACGDGNCGLGENKCNCPKDCDPEPCLKEGETKWSNIPPIGDDKYYTVNPVKCCAGLIERPKYDLSSDGICEKISRPNVDENGKKREGGGMKICTKCGDGNCGTGENACLCPQDCKETCVGHGEEPRTLSTFEDKSIQCCPGLTLANDKVNYDDNCNLITHANRSHKIYCIDCGDDNCDRNFENECNCPWDCGNPENCLKEGETSWSLIPPIEDGKAFSPNPKVCCPKLRKIKNYELLSDGSCELINRPYLDEDRKNREGGTMYICTKCYDGECGIGETSCNCPQDCP